MTNETICAVSTPPGVGGIAVIRVSGPDAISAVDSLWKGRPLIDVASHTAHLGTILDSQREPLDQCVATIYRAPASYTGEDTVEISVHGSIYIQQELVNTLCLNGCRLAEPGEFTRRAFTAGHLDLTQAEAVADMISSSSRAAHRLAMNQMRGGVSQRLRELRDKLLELSALLELELDFSEEDVEFASRRRLTEISTDVANEIDRLLKSFASGSAIKDGIPVAIVGPTNAGKSSLLNALIGEERAIVSDIHGTTRDTIEETINIDDYRYRFIDTAGLRSTTDSIEQIGIRRSHDAIARARVVIALNPVNAPLDMDTMQAAQSVLQSDTPGYLIIVLSKSDIAPLPETEQAARQFIDTQKAPEGHARLITLSTKQKEPAQALTPQSKEIKEDGTTKLLTVLKEIGRQEMATPDTVMITNLRHRQALLKARETAQAVVEALKQNLPGDLIAQDLRATIHHLSTIIGEIPAPEILQTIFHRFCIGK